MSALLFGGVLAALLVAFTNGANDNLKGVATLYGSGTAGYGRALVWATATTAVGGLLSVAVAGRLVVVFSGQGLVPDDVAGTLGLLSAAAVGTALTVGAATRLGMPVSTTHALTGSLVGAGSVAAAGAVNYGALGARFLLPLAFAPILAVALTTVVYAALHSARARLGVTSDLCVCVGTEVVHILPVSAGATAVASSVRAVTARVGREAYCAERYNGRLLGVSVQRAVNGLHYGSAGLVSLARGLNDTPKIAALLLVSEAMPGAAGALGVVAAMSLGGWLAARRVTETMAHRVTEMNEGQGLAANLVTSLLVLTASPLGLPVSTTHVSVGSIFGVGVVRRRANVRVIGEILLAWLVTLPLGLLLGAGSYAAGRWIAGG